MADSKQVFFIGNGRGRERDTLLVVVKFASRIVLDKWGMPVFLARVMKEVPEFYLWHIDSDEPESQLLEITLKGPRSKTALASGPNSAAAVDLGIEVAQKIDSIVRSDAKK